MSYNIRYHYQAGGSLPADAPSYVVREADDELFDGLLAGEFCYVLNSRQMGKSSLRVRTMKRLQDAGVACSSIDLTGIGSQQLTPKQWYRGLIQELVSCFELKLNRRQWLKERDDLTPVQQFGEFIRDVLLVEVDRHIVLLVDEIDSLINLDFPTDDFFALIRNCYNKRAENPAYHRLTFALFGVATPPDLIQDKHRTPFNIGRAIELPGFKAREVKVLEKGLVWKVANPKAVLHEILSWTGGQPFLTQKICKILVEEWTIAAETETEAIETLVRSRIIENWESQDEPEHLRTIRDRVLRNEENAIRLLELYRQILQKGKIDSEHSVDRLDLRMTGLVIKNNGKIQTHNKIYEKVFNLSWVEFALNNLRPYSEAISAWKNSNCQDDDCLLQGQALQSVLKWTENKQLGRLDYQFLIASQEKEIQILKKVIEMQSADNVDIVSESSSNENSDEPLFVEIKITKKARNVLLRRVFIIVPIFMTLMTSWLIGSPHVARFFNNWGFENYRNGELQSARRLWETALWVNPLNRATHYNLAWLCEEVRDFECARARYQEAAQLGLSAAYSNLARLYVLEDRDYDSAAHLSQQGLELEKDGSIPVRYALLKNLGWARLEQNRLGEAKVHLQEAIALDEERAAAYCLLAQVYENEGNLEQTRDAWETCLALASPEAPDEDVWIDMARSHLDTDGKFMFPE